MSWTSVSDAQEPETSPKVHSTGMRLSLTAASELIGGARTDCTEPHHPSLGEWCPDCTGMTRAQQVSTTEGERL
jgi:hypothetical protein